MICAAELGKLIPGRLPAHTIVPNVNPNPNSNPNVGGILLGGNLPGGNFKGENFLVIIYNLSLSDL